MVPGSLTRARARRAALRAGLAMLAFGRAAAGQDGTTTVVLYKPDGSTTTPDTIVQYVRGQTSRIDAGVGRAEHVSVIVDNATGTMTVLIASRRMYMQTTRAERDSLLARFKPQADSFAAQFNRGTATGGAPPSFTVRKMGTATVLGVTCTVYHISTSDSTLVRRSGADSLAVSEGELCVAPGAGIRSPDAMTGGGGALAMASADPTTRARMAMVKQVLADGANGILRSSTVVHGKLVVNMEAVKIDASEPPASLFAIPAGYTKFSIPSFGGRS